MVNFFADFTFRLDSMGFLDWLDVLLVTAVIYFFLLLLRRSQAAFILRGILAIVAILAVTSFFLPLPTFDLLLRIGLLAILIAMPITLQPELRRLLERIGREIGFNFLGNDRRNVAEQVVAQILRTMENLSASQTGALIVLEKDLPLDEFMASGVRVDGRISAELLQTIFHNKTPLHDGACIIREGNVEAAGCVLPLTNQALPASRRLGTRHRAAVGMSEVSDALVLVVSEETGTISVAQGGKLERKLDSNALRQRLINFYTEKSSLPKSRILSRIHLKPPSLRNFLGDLLYLLIAFLFALVASAIVNQQLDPSVIESMPDVPLVVTGLPENSTLMRPLPASIEVNYQTLSSIVPSLSPDSFTASVSLEGLGTDPQRIPIIVTSLVDKVLFRESIPAEVDVQIAAIITSTADVEVKLTDTEKMSAAYEVVGGATAIPTQVTISGPQPQVERVAAARVTVSLNNVTGPIREPRPVKLVDAEGNIVDGVTANPSEVEIIVPVRSRLDARNVGVRVVTSNSPPAGYWLSGLSSSPNTIIVQGDPALIAELDSFIDTLPVDVANITGNFEGNVALDLPEGITAFDSEGNPVTTVLVSVNVSARRGDLLVTIPVEIVNDFGRFDITLSPQVLEVLLTGPLPTLSEIEQNPELVRLIIDASKLEPDSQVELTPEIIMPQAISRASLIQTKVLVTTSSLNPTPTPTPTPFATAVPTQIPTPTPAAAPQG